MKRIIVLVLMVLLTASLFADNEDHVFKLNQDELNDLAIESTGADFIIMGNILMGSLIYNFIENEGKDREYIYSKSLNIGAQISFVYYMVMTVFRWIIYEPPRERCL